MRIRSIGKGLAVALMAMLGLLAGCRSVEELWPWSDEAPSPQPTSAPSVAESQPATSASAPDEDELAKRSAEQAAQLQAAMRNRPAPSAQATPLPASSSPPATPVATSLPVAATSESARANEALIVMPPAVAVKPPTFQEMLANPLTDEQARLAEQALRDWQDRQPVKIRLANLCRKVKGYGVYETVDATRLVAGKPHRMVVYAELENFRSTLAHGGDRAMHQVKLQQEISIYQQADGFEVLRLPAVAIVDESLRRRRDFFVVQMIDIPGRLTVGRYTLKLRVTDQQSQTQDESLVPLTLVAQP